MMGYDQDPFGNATTDDQMKSPQQKRNDFASGRRKTSVDTRLEAQEELKAIEDELMQDLKTKAAKKALRRSRKQPSSTNMPDLDEPVPFPDRGVLSPKNNQLPPLKHTQPSTKPYNASISMKVEHDRLADEIVKKMNTPARV